MMLLRAQVLALGYSGVRPALVDVLVAMLNAGVHPRVPAQGSVGASGDLAPLAHLALAMIGEGEAQIADGPFVAERGGAGARRGRARRPRGQGGPGAHQRHAVHGVRWARWRCSTPSACAPWPTSRAR